MIPDTDLFQKSPAMAGDFSILKRTIAVESPGRDLAAAASIASCKPERLGQLHAQDDLFPADP